MFPPVGTDFEEENAHEDNDTWFIAPPMAIDEQLPKIGEIPHHHVNYERPQHIFVEPQNRQKRAYRNRDERLTNAIYLGFVIDMKLKMTTTED